MERMIGFVIAGGFYAKAHERSYPDLRGQAFAVVCGGRVIDISARAKALGARAGVMVRELRWLCPEALVVEYEENLYRPLYRALWDCVYAHAPLVEPCRFHEGFFDATGCVREWDEVEQWRGKLTEAIEQATGLHARIGMGPTRAVAGLAAHRHLCVPPHAVEKFLKKAPISWLAQPPEVIQALEGLGVRYVGQLAELPAEVLHARVGRAAWELKELARGGGPRQVKAAYPPLCITRRIGPVEEGEQERVRCLIREACQDAYEEVSRLGLSPTLITLTLDSLDGPSRSGETRRSFPFTSPTAVEEAVRAMWRKLWRGEALASVVIELRDLQPQKPAQYQLWGAASHTLHPAVRLKRAIQAVTRRYGVQALMPASELPARVRFAQQVMSLQAMAGGNPG